MNVESRGRCARIYYRRLGTVFTALILLAGCAKRSDRLEIAGHVTLDGALLDTGSIRFTSIGDGKRMSAGATIKNGAYLIPQAKGLLPGVYHLEINAADSKAPPIMVQGSPVAPERIPPEYNLRSDKTVNVTADGENEFNFDVASTAKKK